MPNNKIHLIRYPLTEEEQEALDDLEGGFYPIDLFNSEMCFKFADLFTKLGNLKKHDEYGFEKDSKDINDEFRKKYYSINGK